MKTRKMVITEMDEYLHSYITMIIMVTSYVPLPFSLSLPLYAKKL